MTRTARGCGDASQGVRVGVAAVVAGIFVASPRSGVAILTQQAHLRRTSPQGEGVLEACGRRDPPGVSATRISKSQPPDHGRRRAHRAILRGGDWVRGKGKRMSASTSWLFHTRRTEKGSGGFACTSHRWLAKEEIGQERRWESSAAEGGACAGLTQGSAWPLFVDFAALAQRQDELFGGLTPLHEKTALVTFIGMGITDANRYEDAAAAFKEFRRMAPAHNGALIEVFTQRHREESKSSDFVYLHFAGDRLAFGLQICALTNGGLMAGWQLI